MRICREFPSENDLVAFSGRSLPVVQVDRTHASPSRPSGIFLRGEAQLLDEAAARASEDPAWEPSEVRFEVEDDCATEFLAAATRLLSQPEIAQERTAFDAFAQIVVDVACDEDLRAVVGGLAVPSGDVALKLRQFGWLDESGHLVATMERARANWHTLLTSELPEETPTDWVGTMLLDEWASALIAAAWGEPLRVEEVRRELRRRGVRAFGIVDAA